jgi:anaerobic magnesium-protoporphyrin IX monomethyl ester cyclase
VKLNIGCIYSVESIYLTDKPLNSQIDIPFGISYIASSLQKAGHTVSILVFTPDQDIIRVIDDFIDRENPALFCLTSVSSQFPMVVRIAEIIKKNHKSIFILLGGVHATLNPESSISIPWFDAICIGEGEHAVTELADKLEKGKMVSGIDNLWIRSEGNIEKNRIAGFIEDLDSIPVIDRSMWYPWIVDINSRPSVLVGRGCPNKCTYCSNHAISKISSGTYVRFRTPDSIIREIRKIIVENPAIQEIYLEVETLSVNLKYAYSLLEKLEEFNRAQNKPVQFGTNISMLRTIVRNEEFVEKLHRAGITSLNIGLESGSERVRKEILRRPPYTNEEIISFCTLAKKYGISINMYVMVGIPGETRSDFQETVDCVRKCSPHYVQIGIFYPYPGTDLYKTARDLGLIKTEILSTVAERTHPIFDLPDFSKWQIRWEYTFFYFNALKGIMPFPKILKYTLINLSSPYPKFLRLVKVVLIRFHAQTVFLKK